MQLHADLLFAGGRVYSADADAGWANAVAVRGDRILAVGRPLDLDELRGPLTRVINLHGRLILPGFTDSHIHFTDQALRARQLDVSGARSAAEVAERVRAHAARVAPGRWLLGGGYDANLWPDGPAPHRSLLDAAAPDLPVRLDSKDLHTIWVNSVALRQAGITAATPDVPGGVIDRDAVGEPTGVLRDQAIQCLAIHQPAADLAEMTAAVREATPGLWAKGLVAIHNAVVPHDTLVLPAYQALHQAGELRLRVLIHLPVEDLPHARAIGLQSGLGDAWLRLGSIKIFADGALGSRTASMFQPYLGEPHNRGVITTGSEEMLEQALTASAGGLSLAIHAIGDRANHDVLDVLAEVRRQEAARGQPPVRPLRHRIEHAQCLRQADLPRLAQLGIIASVQPIHCTSDLRIADKYWGRERTGGAYAFRDLLDSGARLAFGSDGPVESYDPLLGIHAAVTRRRPDGVPGPDGWHTEQRVTVAEAIDAYTRWPAYAAGEEDYRGTITPGKVADLVLLDQDILALEPEEILNTRVAMTVLDGKVVWENGL
jgi:hypothetical protein